MFGLLEGLALANTGIGLVGSLMNSGLSDEQQQIYDMLRNRATQGIDPKLLAELRMRQRNAVGNEGTALGMATQERLMRAGVPIAKQEEVLSKAASQRMGAVSDALIGVDALNENYKATAMGQLAGFGQGLGYNGGAGFAQLLGEGLGSLQSALEQQRYFERLDKLKQSSIARKVPTYGKNTSTYQREMWG